MLQMMQMSSHSDATASPWESCNGLFDPGPFNRYRKSKETFLQVLRWSWRPTAETIAVFSFLRIRFPLWFLVLLVVSRAERTARAACDLHSVSVCWGNGSKKHTKLKTNEMEVFHLYCWFFFHFACKVYLILAGNVTHNRLHLAICVSCLQCVSGWAL